MKESRIHFYHCPVCKADDIKVVMTAKDYTVSSEKFEICQCQVCLARFTQDIPNQDSIEPYYQSEEYISHSNTSKGIVNWMYQVVRGITLNQKRSLVKKSSGLDAGSILDIGCGTGEFLNKMKATNWDVRGLEPDEGARAFAIDQYDLPVSEANDLFNLPGESFDVVTMWHVLEHVHDLHGYMKKVHEILKKNGTFLIAVPNYLASDAVYYKQEWAAYDVPRHLYHFTPKSIKGLLERHNFQFINLKAMPFDGFYVSLLSEKYRHGNTRLLSGGWQGLRSYVTAAGKSERGSAVLYVARKA